jgi:hypothetical protein
MGHFRDKFGHQHAATLLDVVLVKGIVYLLAFLTAFHHIGPFQYVQVVGDGRLRQAEGIRNIAHAHLSLSEHLHYFLPGAVAQGFAKVNALVSHFHSQDLYR